MSVYRTIIGPLVFNLLPFLKHKILKLGTYTQNLLFIIFFFRRALFLAAFCSNFVLVVIGPTLALSCDVFLTHLCQTNVLCKTKDRSRTFQRVHCYMGLVIHMHGSNMLNSVGVFARSVEHTTWSLNR